MANASSGVISALVLRSKIFLPARCVSNASARMRHSAREALGSSVKPVGLYPGNARLTALEEQAEFDRLLAAFLFIRHRHGDLPADAGARQALRRSARQLFERHPSRTADMPPGLRQEIEAVLDQPE